MAGSFEDIALGFVTALFGQDEINEKLIDRLVTRGRTRPHPWSTRYDYICWSGLSDRTFNARLLRERAYPAADALGTRRPPVADVAKLFEMNPAGQRPCPKSTMLFPAFAQYLTDGFIRTRMVNNPPFGTGIEERKRTTSNHEIDQSPLYGRTEEQTKCLRADPATVGGRKGRLKTQAINGEEYSPFLFGANGQVKPEFCFPNTTTSILDLPLGIDNLPPGSPVLKALFAVGGDRVNAATQTAMMNTLWLREHNRLAAMIEGGNPGWDDERVFQTARNIVIVLFIKIVVEEYINHINTSVFRFRSNPKVAWDAEWNRPNWMTAEFSLLYRWHSLVPQTINWGGQQLNGGTLLFNTKLLTDTGLANAFVEVAANNATELGLGNSATFLKAAEEKAIKQARTNNIDTYNEYRKAMKLEPAKSFADLVGKSGDPVEKARRTALADELKRIYGSIDNVEFYVGLFAEPREKNGPLPELILAMVAMDAFSQALTNPLLSKHVWGNEQNRRLAFTDAGIVTITDTRRLSEILARNSNDLNGRFVGMTRRDWLRI
jgi:prostaglandin-endoperoxide synthase 2